MKKIELKMKNEYQPSSSLIQIVGKSNFYLFINPSPLASHPVPHIFNGHELLMRINFLYILSK